MPSFATRRLWIAVLIAIGATACSRSQNQPKIPLEQASTATAAGGLPSMARSALDLGNTEFRAGRYDKAMAAYRVAANAAPENAAPYFGIYMTAKKLGDTKLADSASAAIAARNGANLMLSDSSMRALHETKATAAAK